MRTSLLSQKKNCLQLFRRGVPQLANEMKVVFQSSQQIVSPETDKSARGDGPRSILRVPSLVSSAGTVETVVSKDGADMKDETKEDGWTDVRGRTVQGIHCQPTSTYSDTVTVKSPGK